MRKIFLTIAIIMLFPASVYASRDVVVFPFWGTGVGEELIDATNVIFRGILEEEGEYIPIDAREEFGATGCRRGECSIRLAEQRGFETVITGELTRLGNKIVVRIRLIDVGSGEILFSDEAVSKTEEDLDVVLKRLGMGLSRGKKIESTAEVGTITEQESEQSRRRESFSSRGLRGGFLWPVSESLGDATKLIGVDLTYQSDTPDFFLAGRTGLRWGEHGFNFAILETKIGKFFGQGDFSPFATVGLGIDYFRVEEEYEKEDNGRKYTVSDSDGATGLILLAGVGFSAFRTYDFQFQLDVDYFFFTSKLDPRGDGEGVYPHGINLTFCIKR